MAIQPFVPTTIKSLFVHQDALNRHLAGPRLRERERYLTTLLMAGHSRRYTAERASSILHVEEVVKINSDGSVGEREIASAVERWKAKRSGARGRELSSAARSWFRFLGLYISSESRAAAHSEELSAFENDLRSSGRYALSTVASSLPPVAAFLDWAARQSLRLSDLSLSDVQAFLTFQVDSGWSQRTVANAAKSFRMFFRFAEQRGWSQAGLSRTIHTGRVRRRGQNPRSPPWDQIRRMLAALDSSMPSQCRAKAILLLAVIYGLRRCELGRLKLDDFDWQNETLTIRRAKGGRVQKFPLQPEVGDAVVRYLCDVRPQTKCRHVFLTLQKPYRPAENLGPSMRKIMTASGVFQDEWGLHALRHACATELLRRGTSLRGISLFLGHRDLGSVSIYARSDQRALRRVADFDLSWLV